MTDLAQNIQQPWLYAVAAVVCVLIGWPVWRSRTRGTKDARRMYTRDERLRGFARAGGQCEYDRWWFWRCTRTAEHGDHFYPWSKGGATSMRNYVAACVRCNLIKSAHVPTGAQRMRIMARRARYFPVGVPTEVGEWHRGGRR